MAFPSFTPRPLHWCYPGSKLADVPRHLHDPEQVFPSSRRICHDKSSQKHYIVRFFHTPYFREFESQVKMIFGDCCRLETDRMQRNIRPCADPDRSHRSFHLGPYRITELSAASNPSGSLQPNREKKHFRGLWWLQVTSGKRACTERNEFSSYSSLICREFLIFLISLFGQ